MAKADQYRKAIGKLKHPALLKLWQAIVAGATPGWPSGMAFEYLILRAFELESAEVTYPFTVSLPSGINEQIDGVVYAPMVTTMVESKDRGRMNVDPIAKLRNQLARRPSGLIGAVFSRGGFTAPALANAAHLAPQTILVWQGDEIELALRKKKMLKGLMVKYRMAVEWGMPDFSLLIKGVL